MKPSGPVDSRSPEAVFHSPPSIRIRNRCASSGSRYRTTSRSSRSRGQCSRSRVRSCWCSSARALSDGFVHAICRCTAQMCEERSRSGGGVLQSSHRQNDSLSDAPDACHAARYFRKQGPYLSSTTKLHDSLPSGANRSTASLGTMGEGAAPVLRIVELKPRAGIEYASARLARKLSQERRLP